MSSVKVSFKIEFLLDRHADHVTEKDLQHAFGEIWQAIVGLKKAGTTVEYLGSELVE